MTKSELLAAAKERFTARLRGRTPTCPLCGHSHWTWNPEPTAVSMSGKPGEFSAIPDQVMPAALLTCEVCGNSHFLNLLSLGFSPEELNGLTNTPARGLLG